MSRKYSIVFLLVCVLLFAACTQSSERHSSTLTQSSTSSKPESIPESVEQDLSINASKSEIASSYGFEDFPIGSWEIMVAEADDAYPTGWLPVAYILTFNEDGTARLLVHVKNSEPIARYEGTYTEEEGSTHITLDLVRTYLENGFQEQDEEANAADTRHAVISIRPEEPYSPLNRARIVLIEGDTLFPGQEQGWPDWFIKVDYGGFPTN